MKKIMFFAFSSLLITSCSITEQYMADDVYLIKPSELGIGESTADETSYASFKQRKKGQNSTRSIISDSPDFLFDNDPFGRRNLWAGLGPTWFDYTNRFPYYHAGLFTPCLSGNNWMFNGCSDFMFRSGIYYGDCWFPNNYFYGSNFQYFNMGSPFVFNNGAFGGYGWNANNNWNNTTIAQNHILGPRGSISGYANPGGRQYSSTVKSGNSYNQPSKPSITPGASRGRIVATTGTSGRTTTDREGGRQEVKPVGEISKKPITRYNSPSEINRTGGSGNRTYVRSDVSARPRQNTSSGYSTSTSGRTDNGRSNSSYSTKPTISSGSNAGRSSSPSSSGTSGSSSGRSSGGSSGGSSTGRRQ